MNFMILANGNPPSSAFLREMTGRHDRLLVTDGAADRADELGCRPDIISGDFDSVADKGGLAETHPHAEVVPTPDQNFGDLEKGIQLAKARGASEVTILGAGNYEGGAEGGRVDHMLANYSLLRRYSDQFTDIRIVDEWSVVRAVGPSAPRSLKSKPGERISLIATEASTVVTITGVAWTLEEQIVEIGTGGISNEAVADSVRIEVHEGSVFLCHFSDQL